MEAELVCFMFEFIYMKFCLEMYLFPEVTVVDSMAAVPGVPEPQAGREGQQRIFLVVLIVQWKQPSVQYLGLAV